MINLTKKQILESLDEEKLMLIAIEELQKQTFLESVDCRCFDCFHLWNFEPSIDNDPEFHDLECPNCDSDNVVWIKQAFKI